MIAGEQQMALSKAMRHILAPDAWAAAITFALSSGRVLDLCTEAALVDRLAVDPGALSVHLASRAWRLPGDVNVPCITAGKLIGQSDVLVGKATAAGIIGGKLEASATAFAWMICAISAGAIRSQMRSQSGWAAARGPLVNSLKRPV